MEVTRVFDLPEYFLSKYSDKEDVFAGKENGQWKKWSMKDFWKMSNDLASGLIHEGITRGDKVAIISNNRPEWNAIDYAVQLSGAILVPIYPTISENDLKFILTDSEAKVVFASSTELVDKTMKICGEMKNPPVVYSINDVPGHPHYSEVVEKGKKQPRTGEINEVKRTTKPGDLLTILYTSGTTGTPKGVMLSHHNLVSNFTTLRDLPPVDEHCRALSFLPLNHIYERMLTYLYVYKGVSMYYAESIETIAANIKEVKPHIFTCVPHLLQKVYNSITTKSLDLPKWKQRLFWWAVRLGEQFEIAPPGNSWWYGIKLSIARKLVFSKWKEGLGGNLRCMVSGGAALDPKLARVYWAAGLPVLEGYGLTETSPVIAVNNFGKDCIRFGTVGPVIPDVHVKFADDGEILVKGPNIMLGYYKRPDATAEVIDADGYFHTGDIGMMVEKRFLKITDRKKEIFKTSGGKYIAPQMIENYLKGSKFIEHSMVIGENRKFPAALIIPSFAFLKEWAKRKGIEIGATPQEMVKDPKVIARVQEVIDKVNVNLAQYEKIKKFTLLAKEWSVGPQLTPKLSLKRKVILQQNEAEVEAIYKE